MRNKYIVIEGNIGAGKTSLAKLLAEHYKGELILEEFAENTFLPQFYKDPERFCFPLEMSFMAERYQQLKKVFDSKKDHLIIADYLFDKSLLFAKVNLKKDEFRLFEKFFKLVSHLIPPPDLIIYLQKDVQSLKKNIDKRGRDFEKDIKTEYLGKIESVYDSFLAEQSSIKKIILHSGDLDFVSNPKDFDLIIERINDSFLETFNSSA
jgi:deoxyguanosine kinase